MYEYNYESFLLTVAVSRKTRSHLFIYGAWTRKSTIFGRNTIPCSRLNSDFSTNYWTCAPISPFGPFIIFCIWSWIEYFEWRSMVTVLMTYIKSILNQCFRICDSCITCLTIIGIPPVIVITDQSRQTITMIVTISFSLCTLASTRMPIDTLSHKNQYCNNLYNKHPKRLSYCNLKLW